VDIDSRSSLNTDYTEQIEPRTNTTPTGWAHHILTQRGRLSQG